MTCNATRKRLAQPDPGDETYRDVREHLESCSECREFVARLHAARDALRNHQAGVRSDPAFSARVVERIRVQQVSGPFDELGWAAVRMLPAALALTALAAWTALQPHHGFASLLLPGAGDGVLTAFVASGLDDTAPGDPGVEEPSLEEPSLEETRVEGPSLEETRVEGPGAEDARGTQP